MAVQATIIEADLSTEQHQRDVVHLTAAYALDAMGNGGPLPSDVLDQLITGLRAHPTTMIFLGYADGQAVGVATCFRGFSTFLGKPTLNIHDFAVLPEYRGQGVGRALLQAVEQRARETGCGRITLEVQENNVLARRLYESVGLVPAVYGPATGRSLLYVKPLHGSLAPQ